MTARANYSRVIGVGKSHVRTGDRVQVMSGDDRGVVAKVLRVLPKERKVVVEGVNRAYRHLRPSRRNPQGGRLSKDMPIDSSNVLLYCDTCGRGVKIGHREANGQKERFCRRCGTALGHMGPPRTPTPPMRPVRPVREPKVSPPTFVLGSVLPPLAVSEDLSDVLLNALEGWSWGATQRYAPHAPVPRISPVFNRLREAVASDPEANAALQRWLVTPAGAERRQRLLGLLRRCLERVAMGREHAQSLREDRNNWARARPQGSHMHGKSFFLTGVLDTGQMPKGSIRLEVRLSESPGVPAARGTERQTFESELHPAHEPVPETDSVDVVVTAPEFDVVPVTARLPWPVNGDQIREFFLTVIKDRKSRKDGAVQSRKLFVRIEVLSRNREVESVQQEFALASL